jgi:hypothetical protein
MEDKVFSSMLDLCTTLGTGKFNGNALCEEEALLYEQLCRTLAKRTKYNELLIDASIDEIQKQFPEKPHPEDGQEGAPA